MEWIDFNKTGWSETDEIGSNEMESNNRMRWDERRIK